ncbi:MAG: hypothetical protein ABSE73_04490, partial [Planctomycetota bacterium]
HLGAIGLLVLCCVSQQVKVDDRRGFIADQDKRYERAIRRLAAHKNKEEVLRAEYMYLPEGNSLAYLTLGNASLAGDYLWLTSLQYISSSFRRGRKFELLLRIYENMLETDPHWVEAEINAGKVLSALEPDRYAVERFYIKAIFNNPGNWRLPYEAGRLFVFPPEDERLREDYSHRAVEWFKDTAARLSKLSPGAATSVEVKELERLTGLLALESGPEYYAEGRGLLLKRAKDRNLPMAMRADAARKFLSADSLWRVTCLQDAVAAYKARRECFKEVSPAAQLLHSDPVWLGELTGMKHSPFPADLRPLVAGLVKSLPVYCDNTGWPLDGYGYPIKYDPLTGQVASLGVQARKAIIAASILAGLIDFYRGDHNGKPPDDLLELHNYAVEFYSQPGNPPAPAVTGALGNKLNTTISPFGTPWEYDAKSGVIKLPEECDPARLFKNSERMLEKE